MPNPIIVLSFVLLLIGLSLSAALLPDLGQNEDRSLRWMVRISIALYLGASSLVLPAVVPTVPRLLYGLFIASWYVAWLTQGSHLVRQLAACRQKALPPS